MFVLSTMLLAFSNIKAPWRNPPPFLTLSSYGYRSTELKPCFSGYVSNWRVASTYPASLTQGLILPGCWTGRMFICTWWQPCCHFQGAGWESSRGRGMCNCGRRYSWQHRPSILIQPCYLFRHFIHMSQHFFVHKPIQGEHVSPPRRSE